MGERLVICGGAKGANGESILRLALNGLSQNIALALNDVGKKLVKNVPDLLIDLVEIATYVFCADQATSRGGDVQVGMGLGWRRNFRFVIPVRTPNHWCNPKVLEPLCDALSFLSEDDYAFELEQSAEPVPLDKYLELGGEEAAAFNADEVVLFSGGLDSLGGAIEELSTGAKNVALVSHRSSPKILIIRNGSLLSLSDGIPSGSCMFRCSRPGWNRFGFKNIRSVHDLFCIPRLPALSLACLGIPGFASSRMG
jgi:hypothetical protein